MLPPYSRSLADLVFEQAERYGSHPAVIAGDRELSYVELAERAARVAGALRQRGIGRGDRVGLLINNRAEWVEAFFGVMIAGAAVAAFSTWSTADELDWLIGDSGISVLIAVDRFADNDYAAHTRDLAPRHPGLRETVLLSGFAALTDAAPASRLDPGIGSGAADAAIYIYTSGSSSRPKSVPLTHVGIIENGFNIGQRQGYTPDDRVLLAPPLFWSYGSANAMAAALTHGATLVLQGKFDPGEAIALIEQHGCTAMYTLPAMTNAVVSHPSFAPERVRTLRTGLTIGAPQDVLTAARVLGAYEMCNVYGQTESYGNCAVTPYTWPLEQRAACQGPPLPGVEIRIVDLDGAVVPTGEEGFIEVRGYVMHGYTGASAEQTEAVMTEDGFFRTGDMGRLLADGAISFSGRISEMIKKGGINISPAEVEDVLMRHEGVALAGVVGVTDALQGQLLAAFVVPRAGFSLSGEALAAHCRALASRYKVPDFIEFRTELPVTVTGKLMRRELKVFAEALRR